MGVPLAALCAVAAVAAAVLIAWWLRRRRQDAERRRVAEVAEQARLRARHEHDARTARLRAAVRAGVCPGCGASPVDAHERFQHTVSFGGGGGGGSVYALSLRCERCGLVEGELELR